MTLAPRFLVNLWAGWRVAKFTRRLKSLGRGLEAQAAAFARLMAQIAGTEFGRAHHLTAATTYAQFQAAVPPRAHGYFAPLIARMAAGEANVLAPGRCRFFVETAGTTGEAPKLLPVPEPMLAHFRRGLRDALYLYAARAGHAGVFLGRHVHTGASTGLEEQAGAYRANLDGMLALCATPWAEANLYWPAAAVARLPEGYDKTAAIARAMLGRDVTLLGGTPGAVCALALAARDAAGPSLGRLAHLQAAWPNLECFAFTGAPPGLHAEMLRSSLGPAVKTHEILAAAEGIFAAQDDGAPAALRLFTDAGLFFEFLPARRFHPDTVAGTGADCLPLDQVQVDVDYVLLVTTPAGLCRYVTGDMVRFVTLDPPRLQFVGRAQLNLSAVGERVTEREVTDALLGVCARNGWQPVNFHVAPFCHRIAAGRTLNCHEWWVELRTHSAKTPTGNVLGPEIDAELRRRSADYASRREDHTLESPIVRLVMPGIFDQWIANQRRRPYQLPRCRPDRLVAEQLAALTQFHQSTIEPFATRNSRSPL